MKKIWGAGWSNKRAILVVTVIFLLGGIIWWMNIIPKLNQRYQEYKVLSEIEKLKQAYLEDTLGGATPEETLKMFLTAFKAGDLNLASKYFIPEKQAEYLAKMQNWVKIGKGEEIVFRVEKTKIYGDIKSGFVSAEAQLEDSSIPYVIEIVRNRFTSKWNLSNL